MYPRLDRQGRPWRLDSELVGGMPIDAFMWMQQPSFVLDRAKSAIPIDHEKPKTNQQAIFVPDFEVATTNSQLKPCRKKSYAFLPFRALEGIGLPAAIQQRWKASVAASRSAEWRLWLKTLDEKQQKARVQSLSQRAKDSFWARLWLEYEEYSKRRHARLIAAAARALAILGRELPGKQTKEAQQLARPKAVKFKFKGKDDSN